MSISGVSCAARLRRRCRPGRRARPRSCLAPCPRTCRRLPGLRPCPRPCRACAWSSSGARFGHGFPCRRPCRVRRGGGCAGRRASRRSFSCRSSRRSISFSCCRVFLPRPRRSCPQTARQAWRRSRAFSILPPAGAAEPASSADRGLDCRDLGGLAILETVRHDVLVFRVLQRVAAAGVFRQLDLVVTNAADPGG